LDNVYRWLGKKNRKMSFGLIKMDSLLARRAGRDTPIVVFATSERFHDSYPSTQVDAIPGQAMKQLVNLFRSARQKNKAASHIRKPANRRLHTESLEKRQLLAGDILVAHNYHMAEDVNTDYKVTPLDALLVINQIARNGGSQNLQGMSAGSLSKMYDVSGDNKITPVDALRVINSIARTEKADGVGERIELRLTPRTINDTEFSTSEFNPATRDLNVDVNELFTLEVSYVDLRNIFGGDLGLFQIGADLIPSLPGFLEPVLTETQNLELTANLRTARSGDLIFSLTGAPATTVRVPFGSFSSESAASISGALAQLGFASTSVTVLDVGPSDPLVYQIRFTDFALANQNLPDLVVTSDLRDGAQNPVVVTSTNPSIPPRILDVDTPDPTDTRINPAAVGFNIDFRSRTFGQPAGRAFFGANGIPTGAFDATTGRFRGYGGSGQLVNNVGSAGGGPFIEPFDAYSIPVRVIKPTTGTGLQVAIGTTTLPDTELTVYITAVNPPDVEEPNAVQDSEVLIDLGVNRAIATDGFGFVNIIATNPGVIVTANDSTLAATEDTDAPLNLAPLVTVQGSTTAPVFTVTTQPTRGTVTIAAGTSNATFDPAQDDFTVAGSPLTFVYTATVGSVSDTGTITVNIAPVNDPPVFAADTAVAATRGVALTIVGSTLLVNDRPGPANETGTVSIASVTAASAQGGTVTLSGGSIIYTSAASFTGADTITYLISDGATPALTTTATLTVNVVAGGIVTVDATNSNLAVTEDINATLNLSSLTTVNGSTTVPTFTIVTQPARGAVTIIGTTATFDPAQDDFTVAGSPLTFVYRATVGTVSDNATVTVNIAAVNDPPVFVADTAVGATRGVALTVVGSTLLANDRPGPANETGTVTIAGVTAASSRGGTVTLSGQNIVYTSASTFTGADTITYSISDGATPPLTTTASLTINVSAPGATTVTANDSALPVTEDVNATLNLTSLVTVTNSSTAPTFTIVTQPARGTLTLTGSSITYTPALNDFTTTPLSFVYRAAVGSVSDTGTVTINIAAVNDPPVTVADAVFARQNIATTFAATVVTTNDRPGPANETGTVTLTAVSAITGTNATSGTVSLANGNIIYTPLAGFLGTDRFQYTVSDGSMTATGIVTVTVAEFVPSTISGKIFTDFLESLANPIRDGLKGSNEPAMGGLSVRLSTAGVADVVKLTDGDGNYAFTNLAPGTYTVKFEIPDTIIPGSRVTGSTPSTTLSESSFQVVIAFPGGLNATGNNFTVLGTQGSVANTLDILVSQNRRRGLSGSTSAAGSTSFAVLGSQGDQQFFQLGDGFADARFVELAVNADRDAALLTILNDDGSVESSLLSGSNISIRSDGKVVGLLGDRDDLTPVTDSASALAAEFGEYRDAIDAILAGGTT